MTFHLEVPEDPAMLLLRISWASKRQMGVVGNAQKQGRLYLGRVVAAHIEGWERHNAPIGFHRASYRAYSFPGPAESALCSFGPLSLCWEHAFFAWEKCASQPHPEMLTEVWKSFWHFNSFTSILCKSEAWPSGSGLGLLMVFKFFSFGDSRGVTERQSAHGLLFLAGKS